MMNNKIKYPVLCLSAYYLPGFKGGGPIKTVSNAISYLGDKIEFFVFTNDRDLGDIKSYDSILVNSWQKVGKANVYYSSRFFNLKNIYNIIISKNWHVLHLNSFFSFNFSIFPLIVARLFKPNLQIIVGPRGEFSKSALDIHFYRKKIFIFFVKILKLYANVTWHASSSFEKEDIQNIFGDLTKVKIASDLPSSSKAFEVIERTPGSPLKIIFLSRISPMKNLLGALNILKMVNQHIDFHVFGPEEDKKYSVLCKNFAMTMPSNITTTFHGDLHSDHVQKKLSEFDLLLLPSLGENYCHVISEALSVGLPVLISDRTPWRNLDSNKLGIDLPLEDLQSFARFIEYCCTISTVDYLIWRKHIINWSSNYLIPKESIEQNLSLYLL